MKLAMQVFVVLILSVSIIVFVFARRQVVVESVTTDEVSAAMHLLRSSLTNPRHPYIDFLHNRSHLVTPAHESVVSMDTILERSDYALFHVAVPAEGLYFFALNYDVPGHVLTAITVSVQVNGEYQFDEASTMVLPVFWMDETKDFPINRFGDEVASPRMIVPGPHKIEMFDTAYTSDRPLLFHLQAGENIIQIRNEAARDVWLGDLHIYSMRDLPAYAAPTSDTHQGFITVNSISYTRKNSSFIGLMGWRNASLYPFHPVDRMINTLDLPQAGNEVFFEIYVPYAGYYAFAMHAATVNRDFPSFVTLRINGEIPFAEAASFPLNPSGFNRLSNYVFTSEDGTPLYVFLTAGTHEISIRQELSPLAEELAKLRLLIDHINQFNLDIRRVTGREIDANRTWRLTRYIPETEAFLEAYEVILRSISSSLNVHSQGNSGAQSNIVTGIALLHRLMEFPDRLPEYLDVLSGTNASVLQMVGVSLDNLLTTGIVVNALYVGSMYDLPRETAAAHVRLGAGFQHLLATQTSDRFNVNNRDGVLHVWANYSPMHMSIIRQFIDTRFTPETGIEIDISFMPDIPGQNPLILSRAAGTNPDVAMGLGFWQPFEIGARGALHDFTQQDDFWYFMGDFVPGGLPAFMFNEGVYGVPENVNFALTVYRTDIFGQLGIEPPDTWEDVAAIQAELLRFNMSFFKPIATGPGRKNFWQTAPLIYQHGGRLYHDDGRHTAIDEAAAVRAISQLGDLFNISALHEHIPVFFNSFRFNQTPVGIISAPEYMLLQYAAPEIWGQWNIAPFPGTIQEDGSISRYFIMNGTSSIIFENSDMIDEAWSFLKWFLSYEIQRDFAFELFSNYHMLWLPSNIAALSQLPLDHNHLEIILDSMQWMRDPPRSPGHYILERRLSDIWNSIVFEGASPRTAIDSSVIEINREFNRRMIEFGFIDTQGNQLQPYIIRELDWVLEQIENARR